MRLRPIACVISLLFLVTPAAVLAQNITPVSATASSTNTFFGINFDVNNLINNSGLSGGYHDTDASHMWLSGDDHNPWLVFDLGSVCNLTSASIWQYSEEVDRGIANLTIEISTDGNTYSTATKTTLAEATVTSLPAQTVPFTGTARYVRFSGLSNYGSDYCGLAEVKFTGTKDPAFVGTIVLEKLTDPNDPNTVFTFDTSALDPNTPTTLLQDGQSATFANLNIDTYRVDETHPGWVLDSVACAVDTGDNSTSWDPNDPNDATGANIVVNGGQVATCTFTNRQLIVDLSITKTSNDQPVASGGKIEYTIVASNAGPDDATGVTVSDPFAAAFASESWICSGSSGGTCTPSGSGDINDSVDLPVGASVTYTVTATLDPVFAGSVDNTATISAPGFGGTSSSSAAVSNQVNALVPTADGSGLTVIALLLAACGVLILRTRI